MSDIKGKKMKPSLLEKASGIPPENEWARKVKVKKPEPLPATLLKFPTF